MPSFSFPYITYLPIRCLGQVSPAMGTLGLLAHTHRSLIVANWRSLAVVCAVSAPMGLLTVGAMGSMVLGLQPHEVASVLPSTTTTGDYSRNLREASSCKTVILEPFEMCLSVLLHTSLCE